MAKPGSNVDRMVKENARFAAANADAYFMQKTQQVRAHTGLRTQYAAPGHGVHALVV